jgi:molecular chaperone HscA
VYDLGGGTFDISILKITAGIFEVLATNGDTNLGGDDFDSAIARHWIVQLQLDTVELESNKSVIQELRLHAEEAKKQLTTRDLFTNSWRGKELSLSRQQFETIILPFVERTLEHCKNALRDAAFSTTEIDEVIMVGGSTRVPLVQYSVGAFFNKKLHNDLNPDEVVALGAAVQADILAGNNKEFLLLDITPLSLGIETMGGLMDVLIPRNSKIPTKVGRQYTTQKDGQNSMRISVFQGERDLVGDNRKLAEFNLSGIPGMPAGLPKVEVSFLINADGILMVKAKELRSGIEQAIEVKPQYGLTDAEVEVMLKDSIHHAKDDMQKRALIEAQTEARVLLDTTNSFLSRNKSLISNEEKDATTGIMKKLEERINSGSKDEIQYAIEELNAVTRPFAERVMDEAISVALRGKKL